MEATTALRLALDVFVSGNPPLPGWTARGAGRRWMPWSSRAGLAKTARGSAAGVLPGLERIRHLLDPQRNAQATGECPYQSGTESPAQIWIVPTNEELIVARQTRQLLEG